MAKPDFGPIKPLASHTPIKRGVMDAMKKATSIGPQIRSPKESIKSAKSIGPAIIGSDAPDEFRSPLSAKTIPDLMAQYGVGLDLSNIDNAGLPFTTLRGVIKNGQKTVEPVYRGAKRFRENLNPAHYNTNDYLGWMTHAAEEPHYADYYTTGMTQSKNIGNLPDRPNVTPIVLRNKNTLDLINPNWDDLSQAVASIPSEYGRRSIIDNLKHAEGDAYYKDKTNYLATRIRNVYENPETFKSSPFDAIRYDDAGHPSWAFPEETLNYAVTPGGVPVNKDRIPSIHGISDEPRFVASPEGIKDLETANKLTPTEKKKAVVERLHSLVNSHNKSSAESQAFSAKGPIPKGPNWGPSNNITAKMQTQLDSHNAALDNPEYVKMLENEAAKAKPYLDTPKFEGNSVLSKEAYENPHDFYVTTSLGTTTPFANWLEKTVQNHSGFYKYPSELLDSIKEFPQVWDWLTIHKPK
jgi:hypothetical protein